MIGKLASMRKFLLCVTGLLLGLGSLHAQTIIGTWQGTLPIAEKPRRIIKIARNDNGSLRGVMYRIDYDPSSIPLAVSFQAPDLKIEQDILGVSFQGKLSADGKSIAGTWTQDKQAYPLTFVLTAPDLVWKFPGAIPLAPMAATADPAFEVATIKPSAPDALQRGNTRTRHFFLTKYTVDDLIEFAWQVQSRQIDSAPSKADWIGESTFDIAGEPDAEGQPSPEQFRVMVRKLLTDRFQLQFHTVQKVFPVYALTVEKAPPKLTVSDPTVADELRIYTKQMPDGQMRAQFSYATMREFCKTLMGFIPERQIVDETGLTGTFDFTLQMPMSRLQGDAEERSAAFFSAVQELGLKLVPKKAPLEVIVIDRLEKPTAN